MSIYLDHAATTPLRREALDAMLPLLTEHYGNPSSVHAPGRRARAALDEAREQVARALSAEPREIVFTSGGTESINLALKGIAWAGKAKGNRLITSAVEHHAVLHALRHLEKFGFEVVILPVDRYGRVDPEHLTQALNDRTVLVSLNLANNEVGTVQPMADLIRRVRATAGSGDPRRRGAGRAVPGDRRPRPRCRPAVDRGTQVRGAQGRRCAVHQARHDPAAAAAGRYAGALSPCRHGERRRCRGHGRRPSARRRRSSRIPRRASRACATDLRDAVLAVPNVELTGHTRKRLPGHLSVVAREAAGESIVTNLDLAGIACSTGSACTTGSTEPSHVLTALGYPEDEARGSLRLTLGRTTTDEDIDRASRSSRARSRTRVPLPPTLAIDPLGERVGA